MSDEDMPLANSKVHYETLSEGRNFKVSKTTVHAGGETQWHHHTEVKDRFVAVHGLLTVEFKERGALKKVEVRDYFELNPGVNT